MDDTRPSPFVRTTRRGSGDCGGSGGSGSGSVAGSGPSRWSFGRCSVRSLATLLKRGKQHPPKQLASLSNDMDVGNHCAGRGNGDAKPEASEAASAGLRVRTTVLGCPRKLRASLPMRLPPPPPSICQAGDLETLTAAAAASPLFQARRRCHKTLESIPDDEDVTTSSQLENGSDLPAASLLLELDGRQRRVAMVGWHHRRCGGLRSLTDLWSLFASQWPAEVQALGPDWRVSLHRPGSGGWETLNDEAFGGTGALLVPHGSRLRLERAAAAGACRCNCRCTCDAGVSSGGGSHRRIERLEAEVTSLSRLLAVATPTSVTAATVAEQRGRRLRELRDQCRQLREARDAMRRDHERRVRETRQMMSDLSCDVRRILGAAAASASAASSTETSEATERRLIDAELQAYRVERAEVSALIEDIDATTGELRHDVLQRRCRSNPAEVELLALHLSRATQRLATLKNRFPDVQSRTRDLLRREALAVSSDEQLLAEEEARLDVWLRTVKKLTMMLYTFKQLADAQANEPPTLAPILVPERSAEEALEARRDLLRGVLSVCPDHERRAGAIERAEAAMERRRRMLREAAALKAEKTLTAAANRLKPVPRERCQVQN